MDPRRLQIIAGVLLLIAAGLPNPPSADSASQKQPWGGNPFLATRQGPSSADATQEGVLTLNGIIWDAQAPSAVINNRVLNPGDWIDRWRVVEIQRDRVIVSDGQTTRTLEAQ